MEIYGFIPIIKGSLGGYESQIQLPSDRLFVEGTETAQKNVYSCVVTAKCVVSERVPSGDTSSGSTGSSYDKYVTISTGVTITTNDALDIVTISPFDLVTRSGSTVTINNIRSTIVNLLFTHSNTGDTEEITKKVLDNLKKLPELDLDAKNFLITNGKIVEEQLLSGVEGVPSKNRVIWQGDYPLDKLIYVIRSNLDILSYNQFLKNDQYAGFYSQLFGKAMELAIDLEKHRITTLANLYLGLLRVLSEYDVSKLKMATARLQCRVYYAQYQGFRSNNINKLFGSQLDGSSSAFAAGMTDVTPPVFNDATLMTTYSQVATAMSDM